MPCVFDTADVVPVSSSGPIFVIKVMPTSTSRISAAQQHYFLLLAPRQGKLAYSLGTVAKSAATVREYGFYSPLAFDLHYSRRTLSL